MHVQNSTSSAYIKQCIIQNCVLNPKCLIHIYSTNEQCEYLAYSIKQHFFYCLNKCCLRASVDTEMCCPEGTCDVNISYY